MLSNLIRLADELTEYDSYFTLLSVDEHSVHSLDIERQELQNLWNVFKTEYNEITTKLVGTEPRTTRSATNEAASQQSEAVLAKTKYREVYKVYVRCLTQINSLADLKQNSNVDHSIAQNPSSDPSASHIKLPPIEVDTFYGDYLSWPLYRDMFTAFVINNTSIQSPIAKLSYLMNTTRGEARDIIKRAPMSNQGFSIAWKNLSDRYENKRILINNQLRILFSLSPIEKESGGSIKQLQQTINDCLNTLKSLGIEVEEWDPIIVYLCSTHLPMETLGLWEQSIDCKTDMPGWQDLDSFLTNRYQTLESISDIKGSKVPSVKPIKKVTRPTNIEVQNVRMYHANTSPMKCQLCKADHLFRSCPSFERMSTDDRFSATMKHRLCLNCLAPYHMKKDCRSRYVCVHCGKKHHSLLHKEDVNHIVNSPGANTDSHHVDESPIYNGDQAQIFTTQTFNHENIAVLGTARVLVKYGDLVYTARALIDPASEASFVSERLQKLLKIKTNLTNTQVVGLNETVSALSTKKCSLIISSPLNPSIELTADVLIVPKLTGLLPSSSTSSFVKTNWNDLQLADSDLTYTNRVDLLLGCNLYGKILKRNGETRISPDGLLVAQETIFGYIVTGKAEYPSHNESIVTFFNKTQLNSNIMKFWELEEPPKAKKTAPFDTFCEELYRRTTYRNDEGRYVVTLPFKVKNGEGKELGQSRAIAYAQFIKNESRLYKNVDYKVNYDSVITEYLDLGHMDPVITKGGEDPKSIYYLPHHAVIKPESTTTKLRVVFNASSPTTNGNSLNDLLHSGPVLQTDLTTLILKWRLFRYVFNADMEKMYRQILVNPIHTPYQRILFRKSNLDQVQDFELKTVTFGVNCAPYLAIRTLLQLAEENEIQHPMAANILKNSMYVDDVLAGSHSIEEAIAARKDLITVLKTAGFTLRKWTSNDQRIIDDVLTSDLLGTNFLQISEHSTTKTLGLRWNAGTDCFYFEPQKIDLHQKFTKRRVLSEIAKLFDPAGWLAPKVIVAKILMQHIWIEKIDWDEELSPPTLQKWLDFIQDYSALKLIKIPRWVDFHPKNEVELHGFCDASEKAYAATIYIRSIDSNQQIHVHLLTSKTKVAPIIQKSIPKLELCGAELLARLVFAIREELDLKSCPLHLWTDSTIVLAWLKKPPFHWQTFVANRVASITEKVGVENWSHVESKYNPSDLASRGLTLQELSAEPLWWTGPAWLCKPYLEGRSRLQVETLETTLEKKGVKVHHFSIPFGEEFLNRFSSLAKGLRVLALVRRFFLKTHPTHRIHMNPEELTADELNHAQNLLISLAQQSHFRSEYTSLSRKEPLPKKSSILSLNPFLDSKGIIRVNGRLTKSPILSYNERFPILLPYAARLSRLLVEFIHKISLHGENSLMLRLLRAAFWIPKAKNLIKTVIRSCKTCVIWRSKQTRQIMASLPPERTQLSRPFTNTGVDFAGPFEIKSLLGRGCRISKGYVLVFVCFSTKAIHLEATSDMSTSIFLAAFQRFVSRRGCPAIMYSDNGTSFVGAAKQLQKEFLNTIKNEVFSIGSATKIEWKFIPPGAPHMGGLWEAGVKSFKAHLKKIAPNCRYTFEEFSTLLARIEACLNSRPISPMSDNPEDLGALTPGHFLTGGPLLSPAEPNTLNEPPNVCNRWQRVKRLHQHLAQRWKEDYLKELHRRYKWKYSERNVLVGDLVVVRQENLSPTQWRLGRVQKTYSGKDGKVRVVDILTQKGIITRPVVKIVILPCEMPRAKYTTSENPQALKRRHSNSPARKVEKYKSTSAIRSRLGKRGTCRLCHGDHSIRMCKRFLQMDPHERFAIVKKHGYCLNCFAFTHNVAGCKSTKRCGKCDRRHHTLLHFNRTESDDSSISTASFDHERRSSVVLRPTALIRLQRDDDNKLVRALIDTCATHCSIAESLVNNFGLHTRSFNSKKYCEFNIRPFGKIDFVLKVQALVVNDLPFRTPSNEIEESIHSHYSSLTLADHKFNKVGNVNLVLGADVIQKLIQPGLIHGNNGIPIAINTRLGWVITGVFGS